MDGTPLDLDERRDGGRRAWQLAERHDRCAWVLHLRIDTTGSRTTAAELFSTDKMGFGTYQRQVQGAVDNMSAPTVLGLFPYGPAAGVGVDGEDELDIEFSKWNHTLCARPLQRGLHLYPDTGTVGSDRQRTTSACA